ncbi:hypothetical protein MOUN0_G07382 [Monosporozyma unispora]|nr:hypothetical protein C6P44_005302 [Kazachstania unispora]
MDNQHYIPTTSTPPPIERSTNTAPQDNNKNNATTSSRDWQRKTIVQGKEINRLTQINEFLELERKLQTTNK